MIRGALFAATLLTGSTAVASAEIVFVGTIKVIAKTAQCQNVRLYEYSRSTYHPAAVGGNSNFAGLSWVWNNYARAHGLDGRNFDTAFRVVKTGGAGWGDPYTVPATQEAQIRVTSYTPALATINSATQLLVVRGQIRRPFNDPGGLACIATFIGTYIKDSFE